MAITAAALFLVSAPRSEAQEGWWDPGWASRREIRLSDHPDNFQIRVTLPFYDAAIRFTENAGGGLLPYWVENQTENSMTVWVRRVENSDNSIYVYYNNPGASSASSGENTFVFFDDGSENKMGSYAQVDLYTSGMTGSMSWDASGGKYDVTTSGDISGWVTPALGQDMEISYRFRTPSTGTYLRMAAILRYSPAGVYWAGARFGSSVSPDEYDIVKETSPPNESITRYINTFSTEMQTSTWYHLLGRAHGDNILVWISHENRSMSIADSAFTSGRFGVMVYAPNAGPVFSFDDVRVRKYAPDPDVVVMGEENLPPSPVTVAFSRISADNAVVDNHRDWWEGAVTGTTVLAEFEWSQEAPIPSENVTFIVKDALGQQVWENRAGRVVSSDAEKLMDNYENSAYSINFYSGYNVRAQRKTYTGGVSKVGFLLARTGNPPGYVTATLRNSSGQVLARANENILASSLPTAVAWKYFTFTGAPFFVNQVVYFTLETSVPGGTSDNFVYSRCGGDTKPSEEMNRWSGTAWVQQSAYDMCYRIYGSENSARFLADFSAEDRDYSPSQLGAFAVRVRVQDASGSYHENENASAFSVIEWKAESISVENVPGHCIRVRYTAATIGGGDGVPAAAVDDNNIGMVWNYGFGFDNTYAPGAAGHFVPKMRGSVADGKDNQTYYPFPNFPPEIASISASPRLIDRDRDFSQSNDSATITVTVGDNDGLDDLDSAYYTIRDEAGILRENGWMGSYVVEGGRRKYTLAYNPPDSLPDASLGTFTVRVETSDIYGASVARTENAFMVDDLSSTIVVENHPYQFWNTVENGSLFRKSRAAPQENFEDISDWDNACTGSSYIAYDTETVFEGRRSVQLMGYNGSAEIVRQFDFSGLSSVRLQTRLTYDGHSSISQGVIAIQISRDNADWVNLFRRDYSGNTYIRTYENVTLDMASHQGRWFFRIYAWNSGGNGTAIIVDNLWAPFDTATLHDANIGTASIGAGPNWTKEIRITEDPKTSVIAQVRATAFGLDGAAVSQYTVNENRKMRVVSRWEEDFAPLSDADVAGENAVMTVSYENRGDVNISLASQGQIVIYPAWPRFVRVMCDNGNYDRWVIPDYPVPSENLYIYFIREKSLIASYLLKIDDPTTLWSRGLAFLVRYDGEGNPHLVQGFRWQATQEQTVYLHFNYMYNVRLVSTAGDVYEWGVIVADTSTTKTIPILVLPVTEGRILQEVFRIISFSVWTTESGGIGIEYLDNTGSTTRLVIRVLSDAGELLWSATFTEPLDNAWAVAEVYENSALVSISATTAAYGEIAWVRPVYRGELPRAITGFPLRDVLGTFATVLPMMLAVFLLMNFGPGHAGIGCIFASMALLLMNLTGIISVNWGLVALLFFVGVITQKGESERR